MGSRREDERNEATIRRLLKLPENKRCMNCNSMCFPEWNWEVVPTETAFDADHSQQIQQGTEGSFQMPEAEFSQMPDRADMEQQQQLRRTIRPSKSAKRVKLANISLERYMNVFRYLTNENGNVVQPNCNIESITLAQLKSVVRVHALPVSKMRKDDLVQSLVGVELWNPYMLPPGPIEPGNITDEEMLEALRVLKW